MGNLLPKKNLYLSAMLSLLMINMLELSNFEFKVVTWITLDVFQDQRRGK